MIPEQQLKDQCTLEFKKWMVELAEGFEIVNMPMCEMIFYNSNMSDNCISINSLKDHVLFPLLIHRAVGGINGKGHDIMIRKDSVGIWSKKGQSHYLFTNYQPQSLTQAECAMLHCMFDIFGEGKK